MNKTYKAKKIRNLHDLHLEQARIKQVYKTMEQNALSSVITPDAVLSLVLNSIISSKNKKKAGGKSTRQPKSRSLLRRLSGKKKKGVKPITPEGVSVLSGKKKKSYKKLGRSLIIWQTASLMLFVGINIFRYYKSKKEKEPVSSRGRSGQDRSYELTK